jgi:hypothetical protein
VGRVQTKKVPLDNSHTRHYDDTPKPDGTLKNTVRSGLKFFTIGGCIWITQTQLFFWSVAVNTSDRLYDDFIRLSLHTHRETSALINELPEESDQFRFLHSACLTNLKGSVGLILTKFSVMWISIPLDLSSRSFIPLPRFIRSHRSTPLLVLGVAVPHVTQCMRGV